MGKTNSLNDSDLLEFIELQKTFANSAQSWSVDAAGLNPASFSLSVRNPNGGDEVVLRLPGDILNEITALDSEIAKVLEAIPSVDLKDDWPTTTIGQSCKITSGGTPSKQVDHYWQGDIPWVSAKDLKFDQIFDAALHISREALDQSATKLAPVGSLLILVRGMGLANGVPIGEVMAPVAFNQDLRAIHPPNSVLPRFLLLALRKSLMDGGTKDVLSAAAHGTLKIDADALGRITFPMPPLDEQRRIVAILDKAFEGIALAKSIYTRKLAALDELKKSLLHQAFSSAL